MLLVIVVALFFIISGIVNIAFDIYNALTYEEPVKELPSFNQRECGTADFKIEASLTNINSPIYVEQGTHFTVKTTLLSNTACKLSTSFDTRKLIITNEGTNDVVFTFNPQCADENSGIILMPEQPIIEEDVFWSGKGTAKFITEARRDQDGVPEVDADGVPLLDENGKPQVNSVCLQGDVVQKGSYTAVFVYDEKGDNQNNVSINVTSAAIGFTVI